MSREIRYYARTRDTGHGTLEVLVLDESCDMVFSDYVHGLSMDQADAVLGRYGFRRVAGWEEDLPGRSWAMAVPA